MLTATTRSTKTVNKNVTTKTTRSAVGARNKRRPKLCNSLIFQATTNKIAAKAAKGMLEARGANTKRINTRVKTWTIPAKGPVPPFLILVAVRAIAPVAAKPPNNGVTILATPWPMSS